MGIPAFFRWLSKKHGKIVHDAVEERGTTKETDPNVVPTSGLPEGVDLTKANPNGFEIDNFYLDMNSIVHPCTHPEDRPAPKNEEEMMALVFEYVDRVFAIVRPRKLLYLAIDGVAPRAKMNQQRSRRFRAAQEAGELKTALAELRKVKEQEGVVLPPPKSGSAFDSNCITPGTPFMDNLSRSLRYYIHRRISDEAAWRGLKVIISDASVPGEGEHKIMDFIRRERNSEGYDINTKHCMYGADADLIMLSLASHEPHFWIIREEFIASQPKPCVLCNQMGHDVNNCQGLAKKKDDLNREDKMPVAKKNFIFIHLPILREYLEREMQFTPALPFKYDFERCVDDWIFMCFFVGNDFLPHLPSLEIREGAIDQLLGIYKSVIRETGGYLTENGVVNLQRLRPIMKRVGEREDQTFRDRKQQEERYQANQKRRKMEDQQRKLNENQAWMGHAAFAEQSNYNGKFGPASGSKPPRPSQALPSAAPPADANKEAAKALRASLLGGKPAAAPSEDAVEAATSSTAMTIDVADEEVTAGKGTKRKATDELVKKLGGKVDDDDEEEADAYDDVRLWEEGWKERYYMTKFHESASNKPYVASVARSYLEGLCWVMLYYFQGCPSWEWYFPFHYAPFASDLTSELFDEPVEFPRNTKPFAPFEQLMGVLPAASCSHLPKPFKALMSDEESPIIDFYPTDFSIDLNGKKFAWQGVALLPFIEQDRLLAACQSVYDQLTADERRRNSVGFDVVIAGHFATNFFPRILAVYEPAAPLPLELSFNNDGLAGKVDEDDYVVKVGTDYPSPLLELGFPDIPNVRVSSVKFIMPYYDSSFVFPARLLPNVRMPTRQLQDQDFDDRKTQSYRGSPHNRGGGGGGGRGGYQGNGNSRGGGGGGGGGNGDYYAQHQAQPYQQQRAPYMGGGGGGGGAYPPYPQQFQHQPQQRSYGQQPYGQQPFGQQPYGQQPYGQQNAYPPYPQQPFQQAPDQYRYNPQRPADPQQYQQQQQQRYDPFQPAPYQQQPARPRQPYGYPPYPPQ